MRNFDVVIVGGGQAGLAAGYYLHDKQMTYTILDSHSRIGDSWRQRYDSLELFTPRSYSSLPGLRMDGKPDGFPTKDEVADYLEQYVHKFQLPVELQVTVNRVTASQTGFHLNTSVGTYKAKQVIIASGAFHKPYMPSFADEASSTFRLHTSEYTSPNQIVGDHVLVVGGGNSGAQIAAELSNFKKVCLSVSHPLQYLPLQLWGRSIFHWLDKIGMLYADTDTLRGKWFKARKDPIFHKELSMLIRNQQIQLMPRLIEIQDETCTFQNGSKRVFDSIIWATGFMPDYDWVAIKGAVSKKGFPIHKKGVSPIQGLYYIGLPWQSQRGSALLCGVGRDAERIAREVYSYCPR